MEHIPCTLAAMPCTLFGFDLKDWSEIGRNLLLSASALLAYFTYRANVSGNKKKNKLDRYSVVSKLLDTFQEDKDFQKLVRLLEISPNLELLKMPKEAKYRYMGFIEHIELLIENELVTEDFALYMFGYYARFAYQHPQFKLLPPETEIDFNSPHWQKFKSFSERAIKFDSKLGSAEKIRVEI